MVDDPEEFYAKGAEEFAENNAMENVPEVYIEFLDHFIEQVPGKKVLDAGCGPGRDTEYFVENGLEATGIDLAEDMVERAKENRDGEYFLMDVRNLDFPDEEFAGVWCNTVLLFFPPEEMREIVEELARVTEAGGTVYVSFKLGEGAIRRKAYGSEVEQHLVREDEARDILEEAGLEVTRLERSRTQEGYRIINVFTRK